jgi:hypothetical protein
MFRRLTVTLTAVTSVAVLVGCTVPGTLSANSSCKEWLGASMSTREAFLTNNWKGLTTEDIQKTIEIKDNACSSAERDSEPGREPTVGSFQPLLNEVNSGTYR